MAKIYGAIFLIASPLLSIPYGLMIIAYSLFGSSLIEGKSAFLVGSGGIVLGVGVMIGLPIVYSMIGFIGGSIGALLYNLFSKFVGGIEIEVESIA